MDAESIIKITIVNRYYPPDTSVTAESASDLAKHLIKNGISVNIVCAKANYQGGGASGQGLGTVHYVDAVYEGKNKLLRLWSSIQESKRLIKKAMETNADVVIVMTSPPLLNYYASKYFRRKKIPWIYWSLDLFPEAFKANKLVSGWNPIYQYVLRTAYAYPPVAMLPLGKLQNTYLEKQFGRSIESFILPCGVFLNNGSGSTEEGIRPVWRSSDDKIYFGYIGNLGEAHSDEFLLEFIKQLDTTRHRLILVLYGSKAQKVLSNIDRDNDALILLDHLPREELKFIDVHLVSLRSEWVHICVPSKLVSAVHRASCFLFYGPEESDSWQYLKSSGWLIEEDSNLSNQITEFLSSLESAAIDSKKHNAKVRALEIESDVRSAYDGLVKYLKSR